MIVLALETSGKVGSAAIVCSERGRLHEHAFEPRRGHGGPMLSEVETALHGAGVTLSDIDVFASTAGPGSFTGLRVGLATVNALAWSLGKRAAAFGSLEALAHGWLSDGEAEPGTWVAPVVDARKSEVYGALYRRTADGLIRHLDPVATPAAEFVALLESQVGSPLDSPGLAVEFLGTGVGAYPEVFGPERHAPAIRAATVAHLALVTDPLPPAQPRYVRPSSAEVKFGAAPAHDPLANVQR